ncbi:MAG TPA: ATP-binding cassette domain-containing protein [Spirochaetales bacterium]|nr:ATP-binding cassette domain-containing protein [Spirochaetales bacterium]HRY56182.1 ATP-binding cassette domain-containing protein [Spirochaetia bacterium]HRZ66234.1 ATP-binding cassette domain-containing protein [Spirochaetia bacterium]
MRGVRASYDEVRALRGVDFEVEQGEIHGLVGEHRAGKSTLVKILSGAVSMDGGSLRYKGREVAGFTPRSAIQSGIAIVYQGMNVIPTLSSAENIFTGRRLVRRLGFLDEAAMEERARDLFRRLGADIDPRARLEDLTEAQRLMVEVAKAISTEPELLIFDEISSKLTPREMEAVYRLLFEFKASGRSVVYITHDIDEIFQFADRVTILKNGLRQGTEEIRDLDKLKLIKMAYSFAQSREELEQDNRELFLLKRYNEDVIRNIPVGILIVDQAGIVSTANFAALEALDLRGVEALGRAAGELLASAGLERADEVAQALSRKEERSWDELRRGGGAEAAGPGPALLRLKSFPFKNEDLKRLGTILVVEDITSERCLQDYLLRSEKIASVAELATGIAHEISNPLSVVLNHVDLLRRRSEGPELERLGKIERELNRIGEIIGSLLSFSRVRSLPMRPLRLGALLADVALLVEHRLREKAVDFRLPRLTGELSVYGDENSLKQVFVNLIINSVEAVSEGGVIELRAQAKEPEGYVEIAVLDDGCGIPPGIAERIFDPFFSTKEGKKNTGLGLSICQHIIESHEGAIFCSPGEMTSMVVRLPAWGEGSAGRGGAEEGRG